MTIVFDIDGTLVDSKKRHYIVLKNILDEMSIPYDSDKIKDYVQYKCDGKTTKQYLNEILKLNTNLCNKISLLWQSQIEDNQYIKYDELYFDTIEVLKQAKFNRCRIIFLSARKNKDGLKSQLQRLGIFDYCDAFYVVNPENAKEEKLSISLNLLNLFKDVMIVGDTEVDDYVANCLNLKKYILNRGFRSEKFWEKKNLKSYSNLLTLLEVANDKL